MGTRKRHPLVHINKRYGGTAKGIIAIVLLSLGGISLGLIVALGSFALSNNVPVGGYALAKEIAIGGVTRGRICIFNESGVGEFLYNVNEYTREELVRALQMVKPDISNFLLKIIRSVSL